MWAVTDSPLRRRTAAVRVRGVEFARERPGREQGIGESAVPRVLRGLSERGGRRSLVVPPLWPLRSERCGRLAHRRAEVGHGGVDTGPCPAGLREDHFGRRPAAAGNGGQGFGHSEPVRPRHPRVAVDIAPVRRARADAQVRRMRETVRRLSRSPVKTMDPDSIRLCAGRGRCGRQGRSAVPPCPANCLTGCAVANDSNCVPDAGVAARNSSASCTRRSRVRCQPPRTPATPCPNRWGSAPSPGVAPGMGRYHNIPLTVGRTAQ
ncbi:hypothetical protein EHYA_06872 [Embleya hyalina]|uniref:Uncharacterized protein n=1 Tax=Embleya hyalina TaxID=516124 RepID=A0A401YX33_9ACTN|nr:hypothetical protein EHYA_06872 [Embleya hyalina]